MKAKITLAEAATGHPDGTISMLRAGIDRVAGSKPPFSLQASLVIRIETEITDQGPHQVQVRCLDEDGKQALPPLIGNFAAAQSGGTTNLILGISTAFQKPGRFIFYVTVDNVELDHWAMLVIQREETK